MAKKYLMLEMDDEKLKAVAEVLGNKTCHDIMDLLAEERELSASDLAQKLKCSASTIDYNIKKLIDAQLIRRTNNFFWSQKGKKIVLYELSNKSILIAPKKSKVRDDLKKILPVAILSGVGTIGAWMIGKSLATVSEPLAQAAPSAVTRYAADSGAEMMAVAAEKGTEVVLTGSAYASIAPAGWIWFGLGSVFAILLFVIFSLLAHEKAERRHIQ